MSKPITISIKNNTEYSTFKDITANELFPVVSQQYKIDGQTKFKLPIIESTALISEDRKHRFTLKRVWDHKKPMIMFIGLNPSKADEIKNDNTINVVELRQR